MKGEKSSTGPYPEALSFDYASTSNDTDINQQICFNNMHNIANNNTLENNSTSNDDLNIIPRNQNTRGIIIHSPNNNIPCDLNSNVENLDHDNLEVPPVSLSTFSDPLFDRPSGSSNRLDSRRLSSKRKSLERGQNCSSSSVNSSSQSQNLRGLSSRDVSIERAFSLNLNENAHSSLIPSHRVDTEPVNFPLTRVPPQLLVQNIRSQTLAGGLRVASSRTLNPSRRGNPSSSRGRIEMPGEIPSSIILPMNILEHQPIFTQTNDLGNMIGVQFSGANWVAHGNGLQYPQRFANIVHRPLLASASSANGGQNSNSDAVLSGAGSRNRRVLNTRSRLLLDRRHDGAMGHSLQGLAGGSEGRSRVVSEQIRNVMDLMRRGENLRFEDVVLLDPSVLFGMIDTRDRHRDMRLDIDNMTYEELLALEESIGDVNTGLGEETILNLLKEKKYLSMAMKTKILDEPCCVCQDEYKDGEDIGALDCGHEFHSACIKQWLMHKNLCPICKTTALSK